MTASALALCIRRHGGLECLGAYIVTVATTSKVPQGRLNLFQTTTCGGRAATASIISKINFGLEVPVQCLGIDSGVDRLVCLLVNHSLQCRTYYGLCTTGDWRRHAFLSSAVYTIYPTFLAVLAAAAVAPRFFIAR
jgi:hypothetical protein